MLDVKRAAENRDAAIERFELIPEDAVVYGAMKLFEEAEQKPAPEPWLHTAIGLMLDSMPGAQSLPPSFRFGLVDLMMNDDDICGDHGPGFSYAVVTKAVREIRRTSASVPNQAAFLKACVKHRAGFGKLASLAEQLIEVRQNAEDVLIETGDVKVSEDEFWGLDNKGIKLAVERWLYGEQAVPLLLVGGRNQ